MRIAIIGAGWAGSTHAAAFADMEGVEIAAIVGKNEDRAKRLAAKVNAESTTDLSAVLRDGSIDAVDVCVPSGLHRRIAVPSLEAGKHVFMETPMALAIEDADAMLSAAKSARRILGVGQLMKFVAEWAHVRGELAKGDMGRPAVVHAARLSAPYWSAEKPRDFALYGDPMLELMIFEYEYLHWLLGMPRAVHARGLRGRTGAVEHAVVAVEYDGCMGHVEGSAMMPRTWPFTTYLRIHGETGGYEVQGRFLGAEIPETTLLRFPGDGKREGVTLQGEDPYAAECLYFVRSIAKKEDHSLIDGESARAALQVALAARASVDQGRPIELA